MCWTLIYGKNKNCQIEIVKDMENFWCQTVSDNGRTCFFNTSLSITYFVACSPQTITNHHISKILKSVVHLILTTSNGSKSNAHPILTSSNCQKSIAHPILTSSNCQSPILTSQYYRIKIQFSSLQIVTSAMAKVMFSSLSVAGFVCLSVCLSVSNITEKRLNGFSWNFQGWWDLIQGTIGNIFI